MFRLCSTYLKTHTHTQKYPISIFRIFFCTTAIIPATNFTLKGIYAVAAVGNDANEKTE